MFHNNQTGRTLTLAVVVEHGAHLEKTLVEVGNLMAEGEMGEGSEVR